MAKPNKARSASNGNANLSFEAKLWAATDALRNNVDAAEYKHVVLGLVFLNYISGKLRVNDAERVAVEHVTASMQPDLALHR